MLADININAANKTHSLLKEKYPNAPEAITVKVDVGKEQEIKALVDKAVEQFGRLDVMVRWLSLVLLLLLKLNCSSTTPASCILKMTMPSTPRRRSGKLIWQVALS